MIEDKDDEKQEQRKITEFFVKSIRKEVEKNDLESIENPNESQILSTQEFIEDARERRRQKQRGKSETQKCEVCDFTSNSKSLLIRHKQSDHIRDHFPCTKCDFKSSTKEALNMHIERHHNDKEGVPKPLKSQDMRKRYNCEKCSFMTTSEIMLTNHREIVHKEKHGKSSKRKICEYCNKKFNKESEF